MVFNGVEFVGNFEVYQTFANGSWNNGLTGESSKFEGERIGGHEDTVHHLSGIFNWQGMVFSAEDSGLVALDILNDGSVRGVMVILRGDETELTRSCTGGSTSVFGSIASFTLSFDPVGSDSSNDVSLGTTSGFKGR